MSCLMKCTTIFQKHYRAIYWKWIWLQQKTPETTDHLTLEQASVMCSLASKDAAKYSEISELSRRNKRRYDFYPTDFLSGSGWRIPTIMQ